MILYGTFNADNAKETPMLRSIDFEFPRVSDVFVPKDLENRDLTLSCDWDESDWEFDSAKGIGSFRAKGVYLNQKYANGHIADFMNSKVDTLQLAADDDVRFQLTGLMINDGGQFFVFPEDRISPWMTEYVE